MSKVTNWLQSHRLDGHVSLFAERQVTWDELGALSDEDLRRMGLKARERQRLLRAIASDHVAAGSERKQLTVLHYDLVQSVKLSNRISDPEKFLEIVRSIHAEFDGHLSDLGGKEYQIEGDGAFYLFGWPAIESNPAKRSAQAAFAIMRAAEKLKLPVPADDWRVRIRVTIASDLVITPPNHEAEQVKNLADRLKGVCRHGGKIVIDKATKDRIGRAFRVSPLGPKSLKGIPGKIETFVLQMPSGHSARNAAHSRLLVGRNADVLELRKVTEWLQSHRLGAYVDVFVEHDVTWDDFGRLGDEDLKKMGLQTRERRRLLRAIRSDYLLGGGELKQLTVLYYGLVPSGKSSHRIHPEAFQKTVRSIHAKCKKLLPSLGGTKYQIDSDGAFYLFGWPAIEGNPAVRSAHAASAIMRKLKPSVLADDCGLKFKITIASGLMAITPTKHEGEIAVGGDPINLAGRLKGVCRSGKILIDKETRDRIGRAFHVAALRPRSFKGIDGKVETFVLRMPSGHAARAPSRPLVGRDAELARLRKQWLLACENHGQVSFLVGTAGSGKSRMALALSDLAKRAGTVLSYQCSDVYQSSALYPLLDRLRRDARIRQSDLPETQIAKFRKLLGDSRDTPAIDDDLCRYLLDIEISSAKNRKRDDLKENAFQLMIEQLKRMTASRPCLLLIEDLQWIDPTSMELLDAVIERAQDLSLLVVVTSRSSQAGERIIGALRQKANVAIYRLGPLSDAHSLAIIANAFEGKDCPPAITAAILKRTEPDRLPFYLEELAQFVRNKLTTQEWSESDAPQKISASMTVNLEMFLGASLDGLPQSTKRLVQIASAVGPKFSHELLESIWGFEPDDFEPAFVELVESRFIDASGDPQPVQYGFRHELLRDAAYRSILRRDRGPLHRHIANTLCTSHSELANQMPEFVAHHWTEAGDAGRAIDYWSAAGDRSKMRSAVKEAFGHYHRAIELLDQIKDRPTAQDTELMLRVRASGVEAAIEGYSAQKSQHNYARILELSSALDRANERFTAHLGLAASLYVHGKLHEALEHGRACLDMAAHTQSSDHLLHGHRILSEISFYIGDFLNCREHANESITRYRMEDHHRLIAGLGDDPNVLCLMYRALSHWILGRTDLSIADCDQALVLSAALGHVYSSAQAEFYAGWLYALMRDPRRAKLHASRAIASCDEGGFDFYAGLARVIHGWAASFGSNPIASLAEMSRGIEQVRAPEADICLSCFLPWLADVHLRLGNFGEGLAIMREASERAEETFYAAERLRLEADLRAAIDPVGALACYARALETARFQGSLAFELRTRLSMCKNNLCSIRELQPLLERMVGASDDHDLSQSRRMFSPVS